MEKRKTKLIICFASGLVAAALVLAYLTILKNDSRSNAQSSSGDVGQTDPVAKVEAGKEDASAINPKALVGSDTPAQRLKSLNLGDTPQQALEVQLPQRMEDTVNPPQWSSTLNGLSNSTEPPDPFTKPPMKVNPRRGPTGNGQ